MHYFTDKFSKIVKRWGLSTPSAPKSSNFVDLLKLRDVFQADYDEIEL